MNAFQILQGTAVPLGLKNVDTDIIISAEHLKVTTRQGLGKFAFAKLRSADPDNVFDSPRAAGASRVYWLTHETNTDARVLYDRLAERSGFIQYRKLF